MYRTGADVLVECLRREGVRDVFGLIGSAVMDITDALHRAGGMSFWPFQHEQGAAYAADGYARATGGPAVCLCTVGPGATNLLTGIAQAYHESSPVIAIAGDVANMVRGKGRCNWHEVEQVEIYRHVTKLSVRIELPERIPELVRRAFRTATGGRPGPVFLSVPRDVQTAPCDAVLLGEEWYRRPSQPCATDEDISRVADILTSCQYPFALAGGGVLWSGATQELRELADVLAMPVASTAHHRGILPDSHPLATGQIGTSGTPPALEAVKKADVLLALGCTFSEVTTDRYGYNLLPANALIIQVDIDGEEIGKNYPVAVGVVSDIRNFLIKLLAELKKRRHGGRQDGEERKAELLRIKANWSRQLRDMAARPGGGVNRAQVVTVLREVLPDDAWVVSEAGGTASYSRFAFESYRPLLIPGDFSAMGSGFCMALGVQVACPGKKVVSISGDGAMMMVLPELFAAVENNIPVVAVVMHNDIYSNIKFKQEVVFGGRYIGVDHPYPSFSRLAEVMGAFGRKVEEPHQLGPAVEAALCAGRPALVEVMLDPADKVPPSKTYRRWVVERQMPV